MRRDELWRAGYRVVRAACSGALYREEAVQSFVSPCWQALRS